jgi:hypothetical protein
MNSKSIAIAKMISKTKSKLYKISPGFECTVKKDAMYK